MTSYTHPFTPPAMDISTMAVALIRRKPDMTPQQFSHHWFTQHAPLVVPMFLYSGVMHYEQFHSPLTTTEPGLELAEWDGAAGIVRADTADTEKMETPAWVSAYYQEVVLVDEKRFLVSEARLHFKRVGPGQVRGERRVVIKDGKCMILVSDEVWRVWREYEARGREDQ
ncbi:hypothetical protein F5884DRAFT_814120 [Xylogone sp. PMI_703]|nr:hypothetical protein F5884DRAFT_814120 [Xylogone sp. PMI_703]